VDFELKPVHFLAMIESTPPVAAEASVTEKTVVVAKPRRVFIGNMHPSTSEGDLIKLFQNFGTVKEVAYLWHKFGPNKGQPKGYAFVEMGSTSETDKAIAQLNGAKLKGRVLYVSYSENESMLSSGSKSSGAVKYDGRNSTGKRPMEGKKDEKSLSESRLLKKQKGELMSVEERMRKLQEAIDAAK